ncbi:polysaccharide pyruvyl transferase family protein [Chromohalobacter sarecensis]|uniref:Polysaccharide pyruvyl transferase family protein n=1 Tax=Chromohalobacter sarecensis TaxID=245294 RepID=A0ABV9D4D0_9GAMM|nr:polysaccharide pyruvyl transferase family protein [Chromohalobacter sarecensis]MCK0714450.1 polysaccharide pyruvyl transferase family protein [Chromohalobacter sarecensis]
MSLRTYYWNDRVLPEWKIKLRDFFWRDGYKHFKVGNAGDILNHDILTSFYSEEPVNIKDEGDRLLLIGSVSHRLEDGDVLCGIGTQGKSDKIERKDNVSIYGLRGPITYDEFKKKGYDLSALKFLLDPGLMVRFMYGRETKPEKGKVVFIPHYKERKHYKYMSKSVNVVDIDATAEQVCSEILSAEHVFSSSLHGIVFAHALNRPVTFVEPIFESMIKFKDYYSSVSLDLPEPLKDFNEKRLSGLPLSPASVEYSEQDFFFPDIKELKNKGVVM